MVHVARLVTATAPNTFAVAAAAPYNNSGRVTPAEARAVRPPQ
jgi:hypothetical protein